ncbi:LysE family translocator [Comamonas sp. Y33R10-2]|uniref:LysE family translocator n=1 Tax=Comamonas sp. Y33R10-2 TaxID=2853257 RepID=UPI001C5CA1B9|nr:LysE family translocator [Comamonas sp. Y33R10-2]QXZ09651.1 LysE family translocator [Comamonas sp. Y33R10-2]
MISSLLAMTGFALVGAITPGPVNVLALRLGSAHCRITAFVYVLGASLSYAVITWLMGQSGHGLLKHPELMRWTPRICAAYLLWLAWRLAHAPTDDAAQLKAITSPQESLQKSLAKVFGQGVVIQCLNPKAWLVALSGVGMFVAPLAAQDMPVQTALLLFCAVSLLACLIGIGCWAALGRTLTQWLNTPMRQRRLNQSLAMLLLVSVVSMLA